MTHPPQVTLPRPAGAGAELLGAAWHSTTPASVQMGQHADAVHIPLSTWAAIRDLLTARGLLGAVWADGDDVYILTSVESSQTSWPAPALCISGRWLTVPADPAHTQDVRLRWLHRPSGGPVLTRAGDLRVALRSALPAGGAGPGTSAVAPVLSPPPRHAGLQAPVSAPSLCRPASSTRIPPMRLSPSGPVQGPTLAVAPASSFTVTQRRIGGHVVRGASNTEIAAAIYVSDSTLTNALSAIRELVNCPPGSSRPVLALALLRHGQAPPPLTFKASSFVPTEGDLSLIRAHAEHSRQADVARAVGVSADTCRSRTARLIRTTGARNITHLVAMAHPLGLLSAVPAITSRPPDETSTGTTTGSGSVW
ncbi:AsnC family protein [Streptomyces sp. NPDC091278]|uniref:AsnC family protein n=1 Tax=Streptomyces sp. NPDC091278 TaxID=3155301 RepID=UPI00344C3518